MMLLLGMLMMVGTGQMIQITKTYDICNKSEFRTQHCKLSKKLKEIKPSKR